MATNEEIISQCITNKYSFGSQELSKAMNLARADEVEAWEEWKEESYWIMATKDVNPDNNGKYYDVRGTQNKKTHYTFKELYSIFKSQSKR